MKKLVLTIIAVLSLSALTQAQTSKGYYLIGGGAGFSSAKTGSGPSTTNIAFSPNVGYFVKDNLAFGGRLGVSSAKTGDAAATTNLSFSPFARYYFVSIGSKAKLMADASFGFGSSKTGDADAVSSTNWGIAAGPALFLNNHTALEFTLSYGSVKVKDLDARNTFGVNVGLQIHFGK
jgi:hypothetical protein